MIGCGFNYRRGLSYHLACDEPIQKGLWHKHVVKAHVGIPCRKSVALVIFVKGPKCVDVSGVEHVLDRLTLELSTADPDKAANPGGQPAKLQYFTRRQGIEISDQHMKAILMAFDSLQ